MKKRSIMIFLILISLTTKLALPCTIFNASKNGKVLAGNTEDLASTDSIVVFSPPAKGKHGVVYLGFERYGIQGAMNDQGLFMDFNALKYAKMNPHPEKLAFDKHRNRVLLIMEECSTVEEVIALLSKYNLAGWDNFQVQFVDRTGASAVLGPDKNGELFIARKKGDFQVSTNFNLANPEFGAYRYPCPRYDIANEMLKDMKELTVDYFRSILSAVHSEGEAPTTYANICDLTNGDIYIYNFHNFEEVSKFNLEQEFKKERHTYKISSLFPRKTNAQIRYEESEQQSLAFILEKVINKEGTEAAKKTFQEIKDNYSQIPSQIDRLVFMLGLSGKFDEAIEMCREFVREYPKSSAIYKKLGDLYMRKADQKRAIECYKKSLELNPENPEVLEIMKRLQGKQ